MIVSRTNKIYIKWTLISYRNTPDYIIRREFVEQEQEPPSMKKN